MTDNRSARFLLLAIFGIILPARAQHQQGSTKITIDPAQRYQEIQGFGINYTEP
jgi:hypothetical protein